ncbi:MAG: DEAD/DEAH box helicase, partial [Oscillospiraceae bacterium]|nr:DEAD/DEAH box helicase [Oscillospiraceae bacterium]
MTFFRSVAEQIPEFRNLLKNINCQLSTVNCQLPSPLPTLVTGLSHVHKAHFLAALSVGADDPVRPLNSATLTGGQSRPPLLVLVETESEAMRLCEDINTFTNTQTAAVYPVKDLNLSGHEINSREYEHRRLRVLSNKPALILSTPEAAGQLTISPEALKTQTLTIKQGDEILLGELLEKLVKLGFSRTDMIEGVSQFAVRGAIVDIFPVNYELPVRLEFWGDTAENIGFFDRETQRRVEAVSEIDIAPCAENPDRPATLFDYANDCIVLEYTNCAESYRAASINHEEDLRLAVENRSPDNGMPRRASPAKHQKYMLTRGEYKEISQSKIRAYFNTFARGGGLQLSEILNVRAIQLSSWSGEYKTLCTELRNYIDKGFAAVVFAGTEKAARTLAQDLKDDGFPVDFSEAPKKIYAKRAYILAGTIGAGYEYTDAKCVMLSLAKSVGATLRGRPKNSAAATGDHTGSPLQQPKKRRRKGEEIRSLTDISAGDYVVHQNYGIGIFEGVTKLTSDDISKDYIKIKYAGTDVLYVPVTQLDFISRYIGNTDGISLKLNKLHTDTWQKTKAKAKAAASELAEELIALYSKRLNSAGYKFPPDNSEQVEFEEHFHYIETDDQLRCIEEIKADMQLGKPMDRLLCGDVGFGKTEVALRAVFKCVSAGKQAAILVPTTILAWQHYNT